MNIPLPGTAGPEIVTQESLLLGAAERIGRIRDGRLAVHIHLSRLRPQNRQDGHIRIALRMLEPMVNAYRGQMFLLGNSDIVFMVKEPNPVDVENMVFKLRALFSKDPLTFADAGDGKDNFCSWFDLGTPDYDDFLAMAQAAAAEARKRARDKAVAAGPKPLEPKILGELLERLSNMNVSGLVRRQAGMVLSQQSGSRVLFQEFFVSLAELQKGLAPDVNLLGNRWLFQHLSQTLDERVLAALRAKSFAVAPPMLALNLNISTVLGAAFERFAAALAGIPISVEFQVLDVLADSRGFFAARQKLRDAGHMVAIDGLSELTLQFMDVSQFDADLYKVTWGTEMADRERGDMVAASLRGLDEASLLLARCDSETAITWGRDIGIERFQGRYVDAMLAAFTMRGCDKAAACTLPQCIARHGVIDGLLRGECGNHAMLDSSPVLAPPRAKPAEPAAGQASTSGGETTKDTGR